MANREKHPISHSEYQQKRFEIAKELLASAISKGNIDMTNTENRYSDSIIYNCTQLSEMLLKELGYVKSDKALINKEKSIHNLRDILKNSED